MVYFDPDMAISRVVNFSQGTVHGLTFDLHPRQPGSSYQKIAELAPIDGGKVSGTVLGFDLEGNLVSAVVYRDGRPNGPGTEYYSDGSVRSETEYVDGRQNGGKRSFRQGQMQKDQPGFTQVQLFEEILAEANRMVDAANEILANKNG
jgi:antitoxin component YwqK of YwqJK toxin-antitoxin module